MDMRRFALAIAIMAALSGCGTRKVTPTAMTQPGDEQLQCPAIVQQIKSNREAAAVYLRQDQNVATANVIFAIIGPVFLVDLSNEEQIKARSLVDRNDRLVLLGRSKGCSEP